MAPPVTGEHADYVPTMLDRIEARHWLQYTAEYAKTVRHSLGDETLPLTYERCLPDLDQIAEYLDNARKALRGQHTRATSLLQNLGESGGMTTGRKRPARTGD